jgi:hypothetical protein
MAAALWATMLLARVMAAMFLSMMVNSLRLLVRTLWSNNIKDTIFKDISSKKKLYLKIIIINKKHSKSIGFTSYIKETKIFFLLNPTLNLLDLNIST